MGDVLVLCYHAVSESWPWSYSVPPGQLEDQLRALTAKGYRASTLSQAAEEGPSGKTLVVTFDDAYMSVFEHALPVLRRLGIPGTVFACTDLVGGSRSMANTVDQWNEGRFQHELTTMSWNELGQLVAVGWEVGSHTQTHARLPDLDNASLARELRDSKQECERRLGQACRSLAYPFGAYDGRVVEHASAAGYSVAATCFPGMLRQPPPLEWPRVCISRHHDARRFARKVSQPMRRFRASAIGDLAARVAYRRRAGDPPRRPARQAAVRPGA
jgi:peptidoglycan/xylan/chitin deacetylase (PgdA/CDA1 family)